MSARREPGGGLGGGGSDMTTVFGLREAAAAIEFRLFLSVGALLRALWELRLGARNEFAY